MNRLCFGDNLEVLQRIKDESVDLIYLDPPFNSKTSFNVFFPSPSGGMAQAQRHAFDDTWKWDTKAEHAYQTVMARGTESSQVLGALRTFLGDSDLMAYLAMMAVRLDALRNVLKPTGSIYLHCDPTAGHYLKVLLDAIFGKRAFKNEIIWHYRKWPSGKYTFQRNHDTIFFYSKSEDSARTFNQLYMERAASTLKRFGNKKIISGHDKDGNRVPAQMAEEESDGVRMDDVWDIGRVPPIKQIFPTQKPDKLLKRIIEASTNEGDVVLDPFCGCGTAVAMAQELRRKWIGIDVAFEAMMIVEARLQSMDRSLKRGKNYTLEGIPLDLVGARALAKHDPYSFQSWAVSLLKGGQPHGRKAPEQEIKKGKDRGIDGLIFFASANRKTGMAIISVKGTEKVHSDMVRDLRGTMTREGAPLGIFVTLAEPTKDMKAEAASAGFVTIGTNEFPRIQLVTINELLDNKRPQLPPVYDLASLLNLPKALPIMRKESPEALRKQINLMLPIKGGRLVEDAAEEADAPLFATVAAPTKRRKRA